jgi:hypothetical protein
MGMKKQRPVSVLVLAILNIVIGTLSLVCGTCAAVANSAITSLPFPSGPVESLPTYLARVLPGWQAIEVGRGLALLLLGVILIVAAIGLLMVQGWGRWLSVGYALVTLVLHSGYLTYELGFVMPALDRWQEKVREQSHGSPASQPQMTQASTRVGIAMAGALYLVHATALLIVLFLPHVAAAFRRRAEPVPEEEEEDEGTTWRRPRRARDWDDED